MYMYVSSLEKLTSFFAFWCHGGAATTTEWQSRNILKRKLCRLDLWTKLNSKMWWIWVIYRWKNRWDRQTSLSYHDNCSRLLSLDSDYVDEKNPNELSFVTHNAPFISLEDSVQVANSLIMRWEVLLHVGLEFHCVMLYTSNLEASKGFSGII